MTQLSTVRDLLDSFEQARWSNPVLTEVHYGCDCGCGGDSYTSESWDRAVCDYKESVVALKQFCTDNHLEFDLDPE